MHFRRVNLGLVFLIGFLTVVGTKVSLGGTVLYVAPAGNDANDGLTWATAKQTVQAGLNAAVSGDQVWVAAGTYVERITLSDGIALYGGFAGTETELAQRDWTANVTILDGNQAGSVVTSAPGATAASRIDGFTIYNGNGTDYSPCCYGGGILCDSASPTIANNTIKGNNALGGGGICCFDSSPTIVNNAIVGNRASEYGGGIYCAGGLPMIVNNTIAGNSADYAGGAVAGGWATIANTIVAFNSSGISGSGTLRSNCVYGNAAYDYSGVPDPTGTNGNISADPKLANRAYGGSTHIQPDSPCKDTGDDTVVGAGWVDIDNQARIQGDHVDIGADESDETVWPEEPYAIVRISPEGNDANDGLSWALAKRTVQVGINAAAALGGEVWVKAGTYSERITLRPFAHVYGGFSGTETSRSQRDLQANVTILDGQQGGSVVTAGSIISGLSAIDGFTIRNGSAFYGGGINCGGGSPTIENNTISGNSVSGSGGGIYCNGGSPTIKSNTITENDGYYGGGIYCSAGSLTIENNAISGNTALVSGGGVCCNGGTSTIRNNTITANSADSGGGIYCHYGSPALTNCTFSGNWATENGGGVAASSSNLQLKGCVFRGNLAHEEGGGGWFDGGNGLVGLCRFSGNSAGAYGGAIYNQADALEVSHCLFADNWAFDCGGGLSNVGSTLRLTGCAFVANQAWTNMGTGVDNWVGTANLVNCSFALTPAGADLYGWGSSHTTLVNSIVWDNGPGARIILAHSASLEVRYSDVAHGSASVSMYGCTNCALSWGEGNIDVAPGFMDPDGPDDVLGTEDDSLALGSESPCSDAGDNMAVPADTFDLDEDGNTTEPVPFDLFGNVRFVDDPATADTGAGTRPIVDMGAYEFIPEIPFDFNHDGDVDAEDLAVFESCSSGPGVSRQDTPACQAADHDQDNDVDQADFGCFQRCLSGPGQAADPSCGS